MIESLAFLSGMTATLVDPLTDWTSNMTMTRQHGFSFWMLQGLGWLLLIYLIYAQGISAFSYELGVAMGTQEPAEVLNDVSGNWRITFKFIQGDAYFVKSFSEFNSRKPADLTTQL